MQAILSNHALKRCSQRGIKKQDIEFALKHGTQIYERNALIIFLRKKDLFGQHGNLEGLTLVVSPEDKVIKTAYKNRKAIKNMKRRR